MYNPINIEELIYLDACSTSPMHSSVIDEITRINTKYWGNASSIHLHGIKAAEILEASRFSIARKLGCSYKNIIFTSGATESVHLAIKGIAKTIEPGRIVVSSVEHPSVNEAAKSLIKKGWKIEYWPVDKYGNIRVDQIDKLLSPPTKILSIIWGQSEIGSIQPIITLGNECKKKDIIFHTDATQILPNALFNFDELPVDLLSASAHKFQGPKGIGFLLVKDTLMSNLSPIQAGGSQEFGIRAGTESIALISGMNKALSLVQNKFDQSTNLITLQNPYVSDLTEELTKQLSNIPQLTFIGNKHNNNRLPNHISLLASDRLGEPIYSRDLVKKLSNNGISISSGSACSSSSNSENRSLQAIGLENKWLKSLIRISLGPWLDYNQIIKANEVIKGTLLSF